MSVFKINEGMTLEGSTLKERQEIWKMLFDANLLYDQYDTIEEEIDYLSNLPFYFFAGFIGDFSRNVRIKNIPFAEFKERLLTLKR